MSTVPIDPNSTHIQPPTHRPKAELFNWSMLVPSIIRSFEMLNPVRMAKNPVMFISEVGAALTTIMTIQEIVLGGDSIGYFFGLSIILWFTVLFANFAESVAEARGRAQAASLRSTRKDVSAYKVAELAGRVVDEVPASSLKVGDFVVVRPGEVIPADGEVVQGIALVDESAITGESAPVIRESGGDRSAVTGGTRVVSDHIFVRVTAKPGESFLDRMIAMVEGANRSKTPNEIALTILLAGFTMVFLLVCVTLYPIATYFDVTIDVPTLVALLVCLIPTTIGALLAAIGIAGIARLSQANVMAMSGRAVEAAGDVDVLLLDKTGTITLGNRQADAFIPAPGIDEKRLASVAQLASLADETAEGRSIVVLAKNKYGLRGQSLEELAAEVVPFTARTRMSGLNLQGRVIRKGALDAISSHLAAQGSDLPSEVKTEAERIAKNGGTPLIVSENDQALGVVYLKDIVKGGIKERFIELRRMGIKTVMITGDNPLTAAAIAAEAGVDDYLAEATPEAKLELIRLYQAEGHMVAMTGDGTNDAPALAQADVAVAMNTGTQAAKEAGNMVDLDSNPTKLIDIVATGKQMLMTRGALTTFSIANDVAKYFAIIPAVFMSAMPHLASLNVMGLATPRSAILAATIFNAIIIPLLIPIAIRGVKYRPVGADTLLGTNLLIYGFGGLIVPFIGIKAIDLFLSALGAV
ncbi:MAG: potassium-transporting ATPase subunit KdpB [Planctomycetaceae bacterium]|nr:potassium-transporting ATPase subunit KdpB [Planctomycetaceae bacterium]